MIDGNHRLAAIRLLKKEPNSCAPAVSNVDVHAGISKDTEKHITLSEPIVVKSCVSLCFKIYLFVVCASHFLTRILLYSTGTRRTIVRALLVRS